MYLSEPRYYLQLWPLPESLLSHTYQSSEKSPHGEKAVHYRYGSIPILESLVLSNSTAFPFHTQAWIRHQGARKAGVRPQLCDIIGWTQPLSCTFDSGENTDIPVKVYFSCLDAELSEIQHFKYNIHILEKLINGPNSWTLFPPSRQSKNVYFPLVSTGEQVVRQKPQKHT